MTEALERVLQLVAEGRLSAEEAAPILDALDGRERERSKRGGPPGGWGPGGPPPGSFASIGPVDVGDADVPAGRKPSYARIEVRERGRRVVDLRVPISLGRFALSRVPGLSSQQVADVEEAVTSGTHGPILDVQDADGDGVRIVLE